MKNRLLLLAIILFHSFSIFGQPADQIEKYKKGSEELISFLEYMFNALGDSELPFSDKDVIINESYLKAFADNEVQIEDDLIANREVVTNKDVQAYLKDIDFFFKNVKFELRIEDVKEGVNENGDLFFTVKINRHMQGVGIKGDSVNNSLTRFVEINVNKKQNDLKIVSIYTTKLGEREELVRWWITLSPAWKNLLGKNLKVGDVYNLNDVSILSDTTFIVGGRQVDNETYDIPAVIKKATEITELDISDDKSITEIKALYELKDLKRLNLSNTGVSSLFPLRNLSTLENLNCSYTLVDDLEPLKYCIGLTEIDISNTNVQNIGVLEGFRKLQVFKADNVNLDSAGIISSCHSLTNLSLESNKNLSDISFINGLDKLKSLNIAGTSVTDLAPLKTAKGISELNLSNTAINDLSSLEGLEKLNILSIVNTAVDDISVLEKIPLKKMYCDGSKLNREDIVEYLLINPDAEIIFETSALESWWKNMPDSWKDLVFSNFQISEAPTPEMLHQLIRIDSIDITGQQQITDLSPLSRVLFLRKLNCSNTPVFDLTPLKDQQYLEVLNISGTDITDIAPLKNAENLQKINASFTQISSIDPLEGLKKLAYLNFDSTLVKNVSVINSLPSFKLGYFDHTQVTDDDVVELDYDGEDAILVYKTDHLFEWWGHLDDEWQDIFRKSTGFKKVPTKEEIHQLTGLKKFVVKSILISDISIMHEFVRLRELKFNDTQVSSLSPLVKMKKLEILDCSRNPIEDMEPIATLTNLKSIYAENTQIDDIDALANLKDLEELRISNTEVKDLGPLEKLTNLRVLECSNTRVKNIKSILGLQNLEVLKCFNNNINTKRIDEFKALHPNCEVIFY